MEFKEKDEQNQELQAPEKKTTKKSKAPVIAAVVALLLITNIFSLYAGYIIPLPVGSGKVAVSKTDYENLKDVKNLIAANGDLSKAFDNYSGVLKYKKMFDVKEALQKYYFGDLNDDTMVEGAIKGMTAALNDPYTVFMNKKEYDDFSRQTEGAYVGLGLNVGVKDNKITVISPFDDSPAKQAGILPGDVIVRVNGQDYTGNDLEQAVAVMRGKENEEVTVTFYRDKVGLFDKKMKRAKITLVTVKGKMLDSNIGLIELTMFDENTGEAFNQKLKELMNAGMKGLVLDLRGNPGGLLTSCIDITSNFVGKDKVITSTKDKNNQEKLYKSKGGMALGMPLVVLTDDGTASASEIFSGAIRDYKLGTLIGKTTFGKGVVQSMVDFKDGTALKVTISKYYTPNGENIHKIGIKPDIEVALPDELKGKDFDEIGDKDPQFQKALETIKGKIK